MNIATAKEQIKDTVEAYLQKDDAGMYVISPSRQRPMFLVGAPGIGKTAIIEQIAQELQIGVVSYSMTHHTRQSALGLPRIVHCEFEGFEYEASEYTMSEIVSAIYDYMERSGERKGILFLDEINCVSETLYPSMLQFLQFKTFGKHAVPSGWVIACAGNPPEYNRSVHEFDVVTLDRVRRIEVEPDIDAWKSYATNAGVHPAVTTFLEAERDCFYRIESTPGGKRFVTARGWEDLSRMMAVCERLEMSVDQELVEQFVQDGEIAERFSLYYDLFRKYRSDYQVPAILAGEMPESIVERAREAQLDERMALLGLLLDALTPEAADLLVQEEALTDVRDVLRGCKGDFLGGAAVADALDPAIAERERRLSQFEAAGVRALPGGRVGHRALGMLKACKNACVLAGCMAGGDAFEAIHQEFRGYAGAFEAAVGAFRDKMENAYSFLEDAFGGGNEMVLFTTELTSRHATARFVSRYGCEAFSRNSQSMQTTAVHDDLVQRIDALRSAESGGAGSDAGGDAVGGEAYGEEGGGPDEAGQDSGNAKSGPDDRVNGAGLEGGPKGAGAETEKAPLSAATCSNSAKPATNDQLAAYYKHAQWEYGYASLCHMALPANLEGKTVLDVGCRRGKGVFKLSERVGARGHAIGVDWVADHIGEATSRMSRAARETGLPANNMEFHLVYPEDLLAAGIGDNTVDVVFANSVLHLTCQPERVMREMQRVLKPGGLLVCEVALATGERDAEVVREARALGNSIQAAPSRADFEALLDKLGFAVEVAEEPHEVQPNMGFKRGHEAPVAPSAEQVAFEALVLHATKR